MLSHSLLGLDLNIVFENELLRRLFCPQLLDDSARAGPCNQVSLKQLIGSAALLFVAISNSLFFISNHNGVKVSDWTGEYVVGGKLVAIHIVPAHWTACGDRTLPAPVVLPKLWRCTLNSNAIDLNIEINMLANL